MEPFIKNVASRMQNLKLRAADIARLCNINKTSIHRYLNGSRDIPLDVACKIADALQTTLNDLMYDGKAKCVSSATDIDLDILRRAINNIDYILFTTQVVMGSQMRAKLYASCYLYYIDSKNTQPLSISRFNSLLALCKKHG